MGLRVNTNVFALTAQRHLSAVSASLADRSARLSSGLRIAKAGDDAAGLGISESMRAEVRSYAVASRNLQDGVSLVQTADGALAEVSNMLGRVRELVVRSRNGTLSDDDLTALDQEYQGIVDELGRVIRDTEFNGISLFDVARRVQIQAGTGDTADDRIQIDLEDLGWIASTLGIFNLESSVMRRFVHDNIDTFISEVSRVRGEFGATQNRLTSALASSLTARENLAAAESRIRDVDVARETALLARDRVVQQAAVSVLAQANLAPELALRLLG